MTDNFTQHSLPIFDINFNETYIDLNDTNDEKRHITAERSHIIIYLIIGKWNCFIMLTSGNHIKISILRQKRFTEW